MGLAFRTLETVILEHSNVSRLTILYAAYGLEHLLVYSVEPCGFLNI